MRVCDRTDFVLEDEQRSVVAEVTSLLDGLPLAVELAAARTAVLSPAQLLLRLRDRFHLLAARGGTGRQATMRATIDWSWQLLGAWEQSALEQCSVFEGGFTLAAAEAVVDLSHWPEAPLVIDVVQALVEKSLLRRWVPQPAPPRHELDEPYFGMYLSIHEYVAEKRRQGGADAEPRCRSVTAATSPPSAATPQSRRSRPTAAITSARPAARARQPHLAPPRRGARDGDVAVRATRPPGRCWRGRPLRCRVTLGAEVRRSGLDIRSRKRPSQPRRVAARRAAKA